MVVSWVTLAYLIGSYNIFYLSWLISTFTFSFIMHSTFFYDGSLFYLLLFFMQLLFDRNDYFGYVCCTSFIWGILSNFILFFFFFSILDYTFLCFFVLKYHLSFDDSILSIIWFDNLNLSKISPSFFASFICVNWY